MFDLELFLSNVKKLDEHKTFIKNTFCERLIYARKLNKYTQSEVATKLNVNVKTYANWEQGRRSPSIYDIFNLIWVLDLKPEDLFDVNGLNE